MAAFVTNITSILGIELTLGTDTYSLGGIALGVVLFTIGLSVFKRLTARRA